MDSRQSAANRPALWKLGLLIATLGVGVTFLLGRSGLGSADTEVVDKPKAEPSRPLLYTTTEPAKNPERLTLLADADKVVGWISGSTDHAGKEVTVKVGGGSERIKIDWALRLKIEPGNTFVWQHKTDRPARVEFSFGSLRQSVSLTPAVKQLPSVYFVVDRSVYRPNHTLHFAAFVRQMDEHGEFLPVAKKPVEVQLKSERKGTVIKKWKLTADEQGRLTGSYTFTDADPLDNYELSVPKKEPAFDLKGRLLSDEQAVESGTAKIALLEYRKAKVQVVITGERVGSRLKVRFRSTDFMNKEVPANKVTFTAQIIRNPVQPPSGSLKGEGFVHASLSHAQNLRLEDLTEDEQMLLQVDPAYDPGATLLDPKEAVMVAQSSGELALAGKSSGEYLLDIPKACQQPGHVVVVEAILTDASGREERKTKTIPLKFLSENLKLTLSRQAFDIDEVIKIKAGTTDGQELKGTGTLVALKLSAAPPSQPIWQGNPFQFQGGLQGFQGFQAFGFNGFNGNFGGMKGVGMVPGRWQKVEPPEPIKRTLATATAFKGDTATLQLSEPGAYKLVAILEQPDGSKLQQEIGCLIQPRNERQPLVLQLDKNTWATGDTLTGAVQSRYADARVLLTIRDSLGVRVWKTLQLKNGLAEIKETLPDDLRYGCIVTAQYSNEQKGEAGLLSSRSIHVEPKSRTLQIAVKTKPVYGPSEKVVLDLQVNRQEPVDLIVSVYDQTLRNIKPSQGVDIRSFYLADERAFQSQARDHLQRLLAGETVAVLVARAKKELASPEGEMSELYKGLLTQLQTNFQARELTTQDVVTLLNLAGIKARLNNYIWGNGTAVARLRSKSQTLLELLDSQHEGWRLHVSVLNDTYVVSDYNPTQGAIGRPMFNPYTGFQFQGFQGFGGQIMGIQGFGGFQGQFHGQGCLGALGGMNAAPSAVPGNPQGQLRPQGVILGADADQTTLFIRRDFSDSAYWNAQVRTDATGKARVEFLVPDSLTSWQVVVTGVSPKMHVGQTKASFGVAKPIMVGPILPRIFTEGDVVKVSANVLNRSDAKQTIRVRLKVDNGAVLDQTESNVTLEAGQSDFVFWRFKAGSAGLAQLLFSAECPAGSDASHKRLQVTRASVEEIVTRSGFCKDSAIVELPKGVSPKEANLEIRFAPTLAADLVDTLDYLVEYPYGCVEQTMSRFLPAIKVAQILNQFHLEHPGLTNKLPGCVQGGIKRLLELQQPDGGWGWNGNAQTHEMMTPYALYGLLQAEKAGYTLGSEQAVQNGLQRLKQFIDNMNEKQAADRIYCMYVYGHRHILEDSWWQFIEEREDKLSDYALALSLELAAQKGKRELANKLRQRLASRARENQGMVFWTTAGFTRWMEDPLEITAAVLKALVAHDIDDKLIPGILTYFNANKRGGRWNSTKDTALIINALCDYLARQNLDPRTQARVGFRCNGGPLNEVKFAGQALTIKVNVPREGLVEGKNTITFENSTPGVMYRVLLRHFKAGQDIEAKASGIDVSRRYWLLDAKGKRVRQLQMGDAIERGAFLESEVQAKTEGVADLRYVLVENPRPSCCEFVPTEDRRFNQNGTPCVLREERETHVAYHHEQTGPQISDRCILHAELAGDYVVAPAQVELMYQTETRGHSGTFRFKVVEK